MKKHVRQAIEAADKIARTKGCRAALVGWTGDAHARVAITLGERELDRLSVSCTPKSREDAINFARQFTRRIMKAAGL